MIKYNPLFKNDGTLNGALSTAPSDSIIFDLPGKCIWVKGVKLKGTDTTYTFSHDNYITLTNTPGDPEDIKIGVNTTTLKNAIDTTYGIVSATVDGLAPKYNTTNKGETDFYSSVYCLGVAGSTLKWYQIPHRTVRINNDTNDKLTSNDGEPLRISAGTNIGVTWNSTTKSIVISNTATIPENTDSNVAQYIASDDNNYRILFKGTLNDDSVIWSTRFSSTLLYNPSTKVLSVNGNAVLHAGNVNSANATIGTSLTTIATIGGVDIKAQISNTDFKVTQTATTTNSDYRVLLKKTANDTEETDSSNFASTLLYNPSTKELKINGNRVVTFADVYVGATASAAATSGLVPAATSALRTYFLRGDGTWTTPQDYNTWRPIKVNSSEKLGSGTDTGAVDFVAGTGITLGWDATNKKITITNSAPDQDHNTDYTTINKGTAGSTTESSQVKALSSAGVIFEGGTNKFKVGDGTNYFEIPIGTSAESHTHTLSIAADSGTSSITLAASTKYKLTAGGSTYIFTSTSDENVKQTPKTDNTNRPLMMINGGTSAGELTSTSMFSTGIYANASTKMITANGFVKTGYDDTSVLLAGGGAKALTDFATSTHNHDDTYVIKKMYYVEQNSDATKFWIRDIALNYPCSVIYNGSGSEWTYWVGLNTSNKQYGHIIRCSYANSGTLQFMYKSGGTADNTTNWSGWINVAHSNNSSLSTNGTTATINILGSSADVSLTSHNHNSSYVTAVGNGSGDYINNLYYTLNGSNNYFTVNYATNATKLISSGSVTQDTINSFCEASVFKMAYLSNEAASALSIGSDGFLFSVGVGGGYGHLIHIDDTQYNIWHRKTKGPNLNWDAWVKILDTSNVSPSLNISGNTIATTIGGVTSSYITVPYATSAGNADTVDGYHANGLLTSASLGASGNSTTLSVTVGGTNLTSSVTVPYATNAGNSDTVDGYHASSFLILKEIRSDRDDLSALRWNYGDYDKGDFGGSYASQYPSNYGKYISLQHGSDNTAAHIFIDCPAWSTTLGHVFIRTRGAGTVTDYSSWGTLAYLTDNVASATKLLTARNINGTAFDGTANISIAPSLLISGNTIASQVGNLTSSYITVPYATNSNLASNSDTVDNIHATGFLRWKGMQNIGSNAPFQAVVDIIKDTTKLNDGGLAMYSYAGDEYTVLIGSRNDATRHGNALKWGYANRYLWLIRMISGNPLSSDWEKIYAGYADTAGNASTLEGTSKSGLLTAFSLGTDGDNTTSSITVGGTTLSSSVVVPYADVSKILRYHSTVDANTIDAFLSANCLKACIFSVNGLLNSNGILIAGGYSSTTYGFLLAIDDDPNWGMALRLKSTNWGAWKKIPMGDGTNASGTWGISITGNAATATKLETARTINGVSFDGTANISIAPSLPISGNTIAVKVGDQTSSYITVPYATSAGSATWASKLYNPTQITTSANLDAFHEAYCLKAAIWSGFDTSILGSNGLVIDIGYASATYGAQILIDDDPTYVMGLRQRGGSGWNAWKRIPMGDGTGASGTWSINITGSAGSVPWSGITGKPTSKTIWGLTYCDASGNFLSVGGRIYLPENTPHYFRDPNNGSWRGGFIWGTSNYECLSFVAVSANTKYQFICGSDISTWGSNTYASASYALEIRSTGTYAPNFYTTSDRAKKQNISSFSEHIRKFQLKDTEKWHYGVIAQEVPEMFREGEEGNMTVNYNSVLSFYIGSLENSVAGLEDAKRLLENKVKMLEERIRILESK